MIKKYAAIIMIYIFNIFPIKKNKIFFFSYYGSQYGDSPKYITEFIKKNYTNEEFDLVWAFNNPKEKEHLVGIRKVKTMSIKYFFELCTSKVVITNFRTTDLYVKRKNQFYIQTWHSSLRLKQIEKDAESTLTKSYIKMAKKDSEKCDLLLSGCEYSTKIFKRSFWYNGEIFEFGTPANDLLFKNENEVRNKVYKQLNISKEYKIALYAPTFRKDSNLEIYNLDFNKILESLSQKFGGKWKILLRLHPHLTSVSKQFKETKDVFNVTKYDDVQELICVSDVLFTDYSSIMFSYLLTKKPCFLYIPDLNSYLKNDRRLYFEIEELPFPSAMTNKDILKNISNFDQKKFSNNVLKMLNKINSYEDGNASAKLLEKIEKVIG